MLVQTGDESCAECGAQADSQCWCSPVENLVLNVVLKLILNVGADSCGESCAECGAHTNS